MTTLTKIASTAVRVVNKENNISLAKVAEFGDVKLGAVVYKDKEWCEYRVMYFADGEHLKNSDYHTPSIQIVDRDDALGVAEHYATGEGSIVRSPQPNTAEAETASAIAAVEAHAAENAPVDPPMQATDTKRPQRNRPRGFYAQPTSLLGNLLSRFS